MKLEQKRKLSQQKSREYARKRKTKAFSGDVFQVLPGNHPEHFSLITNLIKNCNAVYRNYRKANTKRRAKVMPSLSRTANVCFLDL